MDAAYLQVLRMREVHSIQPDVGCPAWIRVMPSLDSIFPILPSPPAGVKGALGRREGIEGSYAVFLPKEGTSCGDSACRRGTMHP